jgi:nucleotide-binding universal stress UspA family protein
VRVLRTITAACDFTNGSRAALNTAVRFAKWDAARVHAVHVIDTYVMADMEQALSEYQQQVRENLVRSAHEAWDAFRKTLDDSPAIDLEVRVDNRVRGILAAARDARSDLLVLGAYGMRRPDVGIGTVATACVRHASTDVLLVRDNHPGAFRTIVAAIDFSPTSRKALLAAARVAAEEHAALHVVHVVRMPWREVQVRMGEFSFETQAAPAYAAAQQAQLQAFVETCRADLRGVTPVLAMHDESSHRSGIIDYAEKVDADLIVLGTRGRTNLRDVLLGSTAEKVLRETPCSVLAIRSEGGN